MPARTTPRLYLVTELEQTSQSPQDLRHPCRIPDLRKLH